MVSERIAVRAAESELVSHGLLSCNEIHSMHQSYVNAGDNKLHPFTLTSSEHAAQRTQLVHCTGFQSSSLKSCDLLPGVMGVGGVECSQLRYEDSYNVN